MTLAIGATLASRWPHEPQPISNQPVGLRFPHPAGRYRPEGSSFSSPGSWSFTCMEVFLMRGWEPILPEVRWLFVRSPANQRSTSGTGVSKPWGVVSTRGSPFSSPGCRSCKSMEGFLIRGWEPILPGVRWLYVRSPPNQRSASGAGVSTPCGTFSTRGITVFVPKLSEL